MEKTSKIINLLTILVGIFVGVIAYLLLASADQFRTDSSAKATELTATLKALDEAEKKKEREENLQRVRKVSLTDDLQDYRDQMSILTSDLPQKKIELEVLKQEQEQVGLEAERQKAELARLEAEITQFDATVERLTQENPAARAALDQLRDDIAEQNALTDQIKLELRDYEAETGHLKDHFASILEAMEIDAKNPSWITIGKRVSTQIQRLSMETGMLVLPLGTTHGMREKMRFFISKKGKRVGQLVIKEAGLAHSVANIVPLIGNPTKLREQDTVEITGF